MSLDLSGAPAERVATGDKARGPRVDAAAAAALDATLQALDGVAYVADQDGWVLHAGLSMSVGGDHPLESGPGAVMVGRNLYSAIQGPQVQEVYRRLTTRVLGGASGAVSFEYRCDAPDVRREMRMSVSRLALPGAPALLLFQSQILSWVHRPWMTLYEPERIMEHLRSEADFPIVRMCSFCQRVAWPEMPDGSAEWVEGDAYYRRGGPVDMRTSHVTCPQCVERLSL